jgi:hypothetical protein
MDAGGDKKMFVFLEYHHANFERTKMMKWNFNSSGELQLSCHLINSFALPGSQTLQIIVGTN